MFGLFKRKFRVTKVDCLEDIKTVSLMASPSGVLVPQLCGDESGQVIVPMYSWDNYLSNFFRKMPAIKPLHHIECKQDGSVICKEYSETGTATHHLLKCAPEDVPHGKPELIVPPGLNDQRRAYLYKDIREFVADEYKDIVCPNPNLPANNNQANLVEAVVELPAPLEQQATPAPATPAPKRRGRPKKTQRGRGAKRAKR
jgi:hypothetical protein